MDDYALESDWEVGLGCGVILEEVFPWVTSSKRKMQCYLLDSVAYLKWADECQVWTYLQQNGHT